MDRWVSAPLVVLAEAAANSGNHEPSGAPLLQVESSTVAITVGALALAALSIMLVSWLRSAAGRREKNHPRSLLMELCQAHDLPQRQRRALISAAGALRLDQPARFFLEPELLRAAGEHPQLAGFRRELGQIAETLFESARKM